MARFGDVVTAMVTPFDDDLAVDIDKAVEMARWLGNNGSNGLVVSGTTGEGPTLTDGEKIDLWRAVAEAVTIPVLAGSGSNDTLHSVEMTKAAGACGVAGALVVTPYYNRPHQAGIEGHFRAVAESCDLPIMIYDIPVRTGRKVSSDVLVRLAREVPNIVAVKDAVGDPPNSARLLSHMPAGFELYSGDDAFTLPLLSIGAVGVVGVATHWAGPVFSEMITAFHKGDVDQARALNALLLDSYDFESGDDTPNPLPVKAMMRAMGHQVGQCRAPLGSPPSGLEQRGVEILEGLRSARG